jgi:hypothetical protein
MKIEEQVVSLELAKELKETGYPQDGLFCWVPNVPGNEISHRLRSLGDGETLEDNRGTYGRDVYIAAPTVAELGEQLPVYFSSYKTHGEQGGPWYCKGFLSKQVEEGQSEANSRAKMWLYLKSHSLLNEREGK